MKRKKNKAAAQMGRKGGKARAAKMTPAQRSAAARHAITQRWAKPRPEPTP